MQLALSIIFFFLGFGLATIVALRPQKARKDLDNFTSQLRHVTNGLKGKGSHPGDMEQSETAEEIIKRGADNLLTKEQLEEKYDMNAWQRLVYEEFKTTILAKGSGLKTFPCVYATMGYRAGDHRYVFLESDNPSEPRNVRIIAPALRAYLQVSKSLGPNTSLVIMGAPTEGSLKSVEEYNNEFFDML
ncbi:hypothetical protein KCU84_g21376, partial [Aureobasidium melanogenum]